MKQGQSLTDDGLGWIILQDHEVVSSLAPQKSLLSATFEDGRFNESEPGGNTIVSWRDCFACLLMHPNLCANGDALSWSFDHYQLQIALSRDRGLYSVSTPDFR